MDDFIELTTTDGLEDGAMKQVDAEDHQFLVARVDGEYYITDARCPHLHGHLARGKLDGTIVTCPLHHSQFDLIDGHVVRWTDWTGAAKTVAELARHPRPLRVYEVRVEGDHILVGGQKTPPATGSAE
jgi:3-phenylpropionate/trans-cinnamate dioxygenase ferredoxin component